MCGNVGHDMRNCPSRPGSSSASRSNAGSSSSSSSSSSGQNTTRPFFTRNTEDFGDISDEESDSSDSDDDEEDRREQQEHLDPFWLPGEDLGAGSSAAEDPFANENWTEFPTRPPNTTNLRNSTTKGGFFLRPRKAGIQKGVRNMPSRGLRPGEYLSLLFTDEMIDRFVTETNSYVAKNVKPAWTPDKNLTRDELKRYFGVTLYMGISGRPDRRMYWNRGFFGDKFVSGVMSRDRFESISTNLHWLDTFDVSPDERLAKNIEDSFWSIAGFMEVLADNCMEYYKCGRFLSIDEMCIAFKGRHRAKVYNPSKPFKWHLKCFCLNDAKTGYLWNFFMYRGKDERRPAGVPATLYPCIKLTEPSDLHGQDHCATIDNWYGQVLAGKVFGSKPLLVDFAVTVKASKRGTPRDTTFAKTGRNKRARGEMECKTITVDGVTYYFTAWMDSKPVHMLTSFPPYETSCERHEKRANGSYGPKQPVPQPSTVPVYNMGMPGTDIGDQKSGYYHDHRKSKKWQMKVYRHFLTAMGTSAHILYNDGRKKDAQLTHLEFLAEAIIDWTGGSNDLEDEVESEDESCEVCTEGWSKKMWQDNFELRSSGFHELVELDYKYTKASKKIKHDPRGRCKICSSYTRWKCGTCGVFLCHAVEGGSMSCNMTFHTMKTFPKAQDVEHL